MVELILSIIIHINQEHKISSHVAPESGFSGLPWIHTPSCPCVKKDHSSLSQTSTVIVIFTLEMMEQLVTV